MLGAFRERPARVGWALGFTAQNAVVMQLFPLADYDMVDFAENLKESAIGQGQPKGYPCPSVIEKGCTKAYIFCFGGLSV